MMNAPFGQAALALIAISLLFRPVLAQEAPAAAAGASGVEGLVRPVEAPPGRLTGAAGATAPGAPQAAPQPSARLAAVAAARTGQRQEATIPTVPAAVSPRAAASAATVSGIVQVRTGANNIFPIAQGHMNRIVTPFQRAGVQTNSPEEIQSRGNVIYVSPRSEQPLTMFIHEDGDDSVAISLTLVPRLIPPVELDLRLPGESATRVSSRTVRERVDTADRWERGQPYVDTIRDVMRRLAVGEVPPGYEMRQMAGSVSPPACRTDAGITVDFRRGQLVVGAQLEAYVGVVRNSSGEAREFVESWCGSASTVAVALSPSPMLAPGGSAEIFIIQRNTPVQERSTPRPSLLQAGAGR